MKRLLSLVLCLGLIFGVTGCSSSDDPNYKNAKVLDEMNGEVELTITKAIEVLSPYFEDIYANFSFSEDAADWNILNLSEDLWSAISDIKVDGELSRVSLRVTYTNDETTVHLLTNEQLTIVDDGTLD